MTFAGARREILNRRDRLVDRRRIKKGCVTLFKSFPTILTYFSSCTACAGLDDAPAMFCLSLKKAAELHKFKEIMNKIFKITMFFGFNGLKMWEINSSNHKYKSLFCKIGRF